MLDEARRRFGPGGFPVPVLLGVLPLQSARHAEFLHNEVPGITIPDAARAALRAAGEHGAEVGLEMALDAARARSRPRVAGHLRDAQLRALRAGRGAGPPAPGPPGGAGGGSPGVNRPAPVGPSGDVASRLRGRPWLVVAGVARCRRRGPVRAHRAGPPFPDPRRPGRLRLRRRPVARHDVDGRGDHRRDRGSGPAPRSSSTPRTAALRPDDRGDRGARPAR